MIRRLSAEDFEAFYACRRKALETNPEAFLTTLEDFDRRPVEAEKKRFLDNVGATDHFIVGVFDAAHLAGMAGFRRFESPGCAHAGQVWGVFVAPEWRARGYGRDLMQFLLYEAGRQAGLQEVQLSVRRNNAPAVRLYETLGFHYFTPAADDPIWGTACASEYHMILRLAGRS